MYSSQTLVSDGTVTRVDLSIEYLSKEDIQVFVDDALLPSGGYAWTWASDTAINFNQAVQLGSIINIRRTTAYDNIKHIFEVGGAVFKDRSVDENFRQVLYWCQDFIEGKSIEGVWNTLDMHGFRITNLGTATDSFDAVSLGQYQADAMGAWQASRVAQSLNELSMDKLNTTQGYSDAMQLVLESDDTALDVPFPNGSFVPTVAKRTVDLTSAVVSVNGKIGNVLLTTDDIAVGDTPLSGVLNGKVNTVDSIATLRTTKAKQGDVVYVQAYTSGTGFGGGYFVYTNTAGTDDGVLTINNGTGSFKRIVTNSCELNVAWGGAIPDGITDNCAAIQRVLDVATTWSTVMFDNGNYIINGSVKIPRIGIALVGRDIYNSKITFTDAAGCIKYSEANRIEKLRIHGVGVNTHDVLLLDDKGHNRADVDIDIIDCYFAGAAFIVRAYGRGVAFTGCNVFDISKAWLDLQFPPESVFEPNSTDNGNVRQGMRGYIFRNNRSHYSPASFVYNIGWNARNARGFLFIGNQIEGSGIFIKGAAQDVLISGNTVYQRTADWQYLELTYGRNITITGNSFSQYKDIDFPKPLSGEFLTSANQIDNLSITNNLFEGFGKDVVRLYGAGGSGITLTDNTYINCFSGGSLLHLQTGVFTNVIVRESVTDLPTTTLAVKRGASVTVDNHKVDVHRATLVHNLSRVASGGSTVKQGVYVGNGGPRNIVCGYEPRLIEVRGSDGSVGLLPYGASQLANGISIGTAQDFNVAGNCNKMNVTYMWRTD